MRLHCILRWIGIRRALAAIPLGKPRSRHPVRRAGFRLAYGLIAHRFSPGRGRHHPVHHTTFPSRERRRQRASASRQARVRRRGPQESVSWRTALARNGLRPAPAAVAFRGPRRKIQSPHPRRECEPPARRGYDRQQGWPVAWRHAAAKSRGGGQANSWRQRSTNAPSGKPMAPAAQPSSLSTRRYSVSCSPYPPALSHPRPERAYACISCAASARRIRRVLWTRTRLCPVCASMTQRPLCTECGVARSKDRYASAVSAFWGLPRMRPSTSTVVSAPTIRVFRFRSCLRRGGKAAQRAYALRAANRATMAGPVSPGARSSATGTGRTATGHAKA